MSLKIDWNDIQSTVGAILLVASLAAPSMVLSENSHLRAPGKTTRPSLFYETDLSALEKKFLGREYLLDVPEKRLQRLELFFFGATQEGPLTMRLNDLKSAAAGQGMQKANTSTVPHKEAVARLEKRILKKTFAGDQLSARLSRLEQRVFGKANPALAEEDRVERLNKTLGIDESPPVAQAPHSFSRQFGHRAFIPFGETFDPDGTADINQQLSQMLRQLDRMRRMAPGITPGFPEDPYFGGGRMQPPQTKLPPYMDPNSI